jgi:hypothetical protein
MATGELPRDELAAAIEARRELGDELEPQVIEGFLDRVEKRIDERVDARLARSGPRKAANIPIGLPLGSIALGIPITGAAGGTAGLAGIIAAWVGIAVVNIAFTRRL